MAEYYLKNKERIIARTKKWSQKNPKKVKEKFNRYVDGNPESYRASLVKYRKSNKGRYYRYGYNAKLRGIDFQLTREEFDKIISLECVYCGSIDGVGVDRVDNNIGYTQSNCSPCCTKCNMMKKDMGCSDFIRQVLLIHNNLSI